MAAKKSTSRRPLPLSAKAGLSKNPKNRFAKGGKIKKSGKCKQVHIQSCAVFSQSYSNDNIWDICTEYSTLLFWV